MEGRNRGRTGAPSGTEQRSVPEGVYSWQLEIARSPVALPLTDVNGSGWFDAHIISIRAPAIGEWRSGRFLSYESDRIDTRAAQYPSTAAVGNWRSHDLQLLGH